nr:MAG TPA: hypothetical protein [Caudoviricetes sp.]
MIAPWPRKSPHAKAAKRLREAVNARAHADALANFVASTYVSTREATARLQAMQDALAKALADIDALRSTQADDITNRHLTNIRDDLAALINEGAGLVDTASSARISEEGLA